MTSYVPITLVFAETETLIRDRALLPWNPCQEFRNFNANVRKERRTDPVSYYSQICKFVQSHFVAFGSWLLEPRDITRAADSEMNRWGFWNPGKINFQAHTRSLYTQDRAPTGVHLSPAISRSSLPVAL